MAQNLINLLEIVKKKLYFSVFKLTIAIKNAHEKTFGLLLLIKIVLYCIHININTVKL